MVSEQKQNDERRVACVTDALNLLYRATQMGYTNGLDECVGRLQRRLNDEELDFRFWPREKWNESQKMKEGGGEVSFLSSPPPPRSFTRHILLAVF